MVLGSVPRIAEKEANKGDSELTASHRDVQLRGMDTWNANKWIRHPSHSTCSYHMPLCLPSRAHIPPAPAPTLWLPLPAQFTYQLEGRAGPPTDLSVGTKQKQWTPRGMKGRSMALRVSSSINWSMAHHSVFTFELCAQCSKQEIPKVSFVLFFQDSKSTEVLVIWKVEQRNPCLMHKCWPEILASNFWSLLAMLS